MMSPDDTYRTIAGISQGIYKEKGSRFISKAYPISSEEEVKEKLKALRREFHDARHHCFAYCLEPGRKVYRVSDDGEPSGTGGKPILGQIQSLDLTNVLIVVVRYFGGIKLGRPGLINAYRTAARDALENTSVKTRTVDEEYVVSFEYPEINSIMKTLKDETASILRQDFTDAKCNISFFVRRSSAAGIRKKFEKMHNVKLEFLNIYKGS